MEASLFLKDVWTVLKKYFWLILILAILGGIIGRFVVSAGPEPSYQASSSILIEREIEETNVIINQSDENTRFLNTAQTLIKTPVILDGVKKRLNLKQSVKDLGSKINVMNENNSQIIKITVEEKNADLATDIANEISKEFINNAGKYLDIKENVVVEKAVEGGETEISHSRSNANSIMGVIIGLVLGTILAILFRTVSKRPTN